MITMTTFTGREVNPLSLKEEDVCIEDIAHALALCNRFAGHSRRPISVAQHSVHVSLLCDETPLALPGLLHDASEAYLGDMTKWLKESPGMLAYRVAEESAQAAIFAKFGLAPNTWNNDLVKWADRLSVRYEYEQAFGRGQTVLGYNIFTKGEMKSFRERVGEWKFVSWEDAESNFLARYRDLTLR